MNQYCFLADREADNERIDKYLTVYLQKHSRSFLQKLIKDEQVLVNGKVVKSNYRLREEDRIELNVPEPLQTDILPEDLQLDIVYEDEDILKWEPGLKIIEVFGIRTFCKSVFNFFETEYHKESKNYRENYHKHLIL